MSKNEKSLKEGIVAHRAEKHCERRYCATAADESNLQLARGQE